MNAKLRRSRGVSLLLFALGVVVFFGFLAIVLDFGRMFLIKQRLRNHCDAGALAGAMNLPEDPDGGHDKGAEYYARNCWPRRNVTETFDSLRGDFFQSQSGDTTNWLIPPTPGIRWRHEDADRVAITTPYQDEKTSALGLAPENVIEVYSDRMALHYLGQLMGKPRVRIRARAVAYSYCAEYADRDDCDPCCDDDDDVPPTDDDDDDMGGDDDDEAVGNDCITVSFSCDNLLVTVTSLCHDISNIVLKLEDGSHHKFDGLSGQQGTFTYGGLRIVGVWVKAGNNQSGDGPGYGEYFANPNYPDGCGGGGGGYDDDDDSGGGDDDDDSGGGDDCDCSDCGGGRTCLQKEVALIK